MIALGTVKFTSKDICRHYRQTRALSGHQRYAGSRITNQRYPSSGPKSLLRIHPYLAYPIKIEVVYCIERFQNLRTFPAAVSEALSQEVFLGMNILRTGRIFIGVHKKKHGAVPTHGKPGYLLTHLGVHHINKFISWFIAFDFKSGDLVAQIFLELLLWAENEFRTREWSPSAPTTRSKSLVPPRWKAT